MIPTLAALQGLQICSQSDTSGNVCDSNPPFVFDSLPLTQLLWALCHGEPLSRRGNPRARQVIGSALNVNTPPLRQPVDAKLPHKRLQELDLAHARRVLASLHDAAHELRKRHDLGDEDGVGLALRHDVAVEAFQLLVERLVVSGSMQVGQLWMARSKAADVRQIPNRSWRRRRNEATKHGHPMLDRAAHILRMQLDEGGDVFLEVRNITVRRGVVCLRGDLAHPIASRSC